MTVQVDSQPVTDQNMWNINMCCINNSISCLKKKMTLGTYKQTCYVNFNVGFHPPSPFLHLWSLPVRSLLVDLKSRLFLYYPFLSFLKVLVGWLWRVDKTIIIITLHTIELNWIELRVDQFIFNTHFLFHVEINHTSFKNNRLILRLPM